MPTLFGTNDDDELINDGSFDVVEGLDGNDTIVGASNIFQALDGGAGDDVLTGGSGDDYLFGGEGADTYAGGEGYDAVLFEDATRGVRVNLVIGVIQNDGYGNVETISEVEGVNGGRFGDVINVGTGHAIGRAGNDQLTASFVVGGSGSDTLVGSGSDATLDYWDDGFDTAGVPTRGVVVNLSTGGATDNWGSTDRLSGFSNVEGSFYADRITGNSGDNYLFGDSGNDTLDGGAGNDDLEGWDGNDNLFGGAGNDYLQGGDGNDSVLGGAGSDIFEAGAGNDTMDGGAITDLVNLSDLNLVTYAFASSGVDVNLEEGTSQDGDGGTDTLANINFVVGSDFNDSMTGTVGTLFEQFEGGAGDDTIDGGQYSTTNNGTNRVTYVNAPEGINANLAEGEIQDGYGDTDTVSNIQWVRGSNYGDRMVGSDTTEWTEIFEGRAGNDTVDGAGGFDMVRFNAATGPVNVNFATGVAQDGQGGTDSLSNIEGVRGSIYADTLTGGNVANDGFEFFQGDTGNDTIDGGTGYDRADYTTALAAATVTLGGTANGTALDGQGGTDTLISVEAVRGSSFNDRLSGSDSGAFESFEGMAGNDTIDGRGGIDRADYVGSTAGVQASLLTGAASDGFGGTDRLLNIEALGGSSFADTLTGNAGANRIDGRDGNDRIDGKGGVDTLDGAAGADIYLVSAAGDHAAAEFDDSGSGVGEEDEVRFSSGTASTLTLFAGDTGIERVVIGTGSGASAVTTGTTSLNVDASAVDNALELVGNAGANRLTGTENDDTLLGNGGSDRLDGGDGVDSMTGGSGNDTYVVDDAGDQTIETGTSASEIDTVEASLDWTLGTNLENLVLTGSQNLDGFGNALNNTLTGNGGDNGLFGNGGNDSLVGGEGNDGLDGGAGNDTMFGGAGNDTYSVRDLGDRVYESTTTSGKVDAGGVDEVIAHVDYTLGNFVEHLDMYEGVSGTGNALGNRIAGNYHNNVIDGKGGVDTIDGSLGSDIYLVGSAADHAAAEFADTGEGDGGIDEVRFTSGVASTLTLFAGDTGIERVVIGTGSAASAVTTGTASLNVDASLVDNALTMVGNNGANRLTGTENDDTLLGNGGNDRLDGGEGVDSMTGGGGFDTYVVDDAGDQTIETGTSTNEIDTVESSIEWTLGANLENLTLTGAGDIDGTGNALANSMAGNLEDNELSGEAGNDVLIGRAGNDTLDGGTGSDTMYGGEGDDIYLVDSTADRVYDTTSGGSSADAGGVDTVISSVNHTLGNFVENLELASGAGNLSGTGNTLGNDITGNEGNNVINGRGGVDTLDGGAGNDVYLVASATEHTAAEFDDSGEGAGDVDEVRFTSGTSGATLVLHEDDSGIERVVVGNAAGSTTGTTSLNVDASVVDNALTVVGNNGANRLTGTENDDTLLGNGGGDRLDGGDGVDTMTGGSGNDTYVVDDAGDQTIETSASTSEIDTVEASVDWTLGTNLERLTLTGTDDLVGTGNALANTLRGNGGDNELDGGTGSDTLFGGAGDDTYIVNSTGDRVYESTTTSGSVDAGGENDTVISSVNHTLGNFVENLELADGAGNLSGTGNTLGNDVTGNEGNNLIAGKGGNDTLTGGLGDDIFRFDTKPNDVSNMDEIQDFTVGEDRIQLENSVFTKLAAGVLADVSFVSGAAAQAADANDFLIYDTDTSNLYYDSDGNGSIEKLHIATLTNGASLTSGDFIIS